MNKHGWIQHMKSRREDLKWHDQDWAVIIHGPLSIFAGDAGGPLPGACPLPREPVLNDWTGTAVLTVSDDGWPEEPASDRTWQAGVPSELTWSPGGQGSPAWSNLEPVAGGSFVSPTAATPTWSDEAKGTPAWASVGKGSPTWADQDETVATWTSSTPVEKTWGEAI